MALFVVAVSVVLCFFPATTSAELQRFEHPAKNDGSLSFLVVGDWGRRGNYNQSKVAYQMGRIGDKLDIDFVISTSYNFYDNGLDGVENAHFAASFMNIYTAKSLQKQWYRVLGNHDYRADVLPQLSPFFRKIDRRWLCLRSFLLNAGSRISAEGIFVQVEDHRWSSRDQKCGAPWRYRRACTVSSPKAQEC